MVELLLPKNSKVKSGKNFELKEKAKNKKVFLIYRYNPDTKDNPRVDKYEFFFSHKFFEFKSFAIFFL